MQNVIIDGIEVELDEGIDPEEVEKYGADSREDSKIDPAFLVSAAIDDSNEDDSDWEV